MSFQETRPRLCYHLFLLKKVIIWVWLIKFSSFLVSQVVKNPPAMQETWIRSLGWKDPLEKATETHSSILTCRIPGTEEPGRLWSMGHTELDTTEQLSNARRKVNKEKGLAPDSWGAFESNEFSEPRGLHLPRQRMLNSLTWHLTFEVQTTCSLCCKLAYSLTSPTATLSSFLKSTEILSPGLRVLNIPTRENKSLHAGCDFISQSIDPLPCILPLSPCLHSFWTFLLPVSEELQLLPCYSHMERLGLFIKEQERRDQKEFWLPPPVTLLPTIFLHHGRHVLKTLWSGL